MLHLILNVDLNIANLILSIISLILSVISSSAIILAIIKFFLKHNCSLKQCTKYVNLLNPIIDYIDPDLVLIPNKNAPKIVQEFDLFNNCTKANINYIACQKVDYPIGMKIDCCTSKFFISFPQDVIKKANTIVVFDDISISGESISETMKYLKENYPDKKILSMVLIVNTNCNKGNNYPDFCAQIIDTNKVNFLWRKHAKYSFRRN